VKKIFLLCTTAACIVPTAALAQSTGTVDFEKDTIVVTGIRQRDVGGVQAPDAPKAKAVLTQEFISRSAPGQTILDTINVIPGVSFQNQDAYGNSGGTLTVRGFDSTRVSYTLDGIQLNDSGNYNIYSNFSIDPELIEQVNVNLGSTDVDSPTASAVGGTINQRTRNPALRPAGLIRASLGQFDYRRLFVMLDTGVLTSFGTRAFVSGSTSKYNNPFNNYGKLDRQQYNAKVYQPVGSGGDFLSVAARFNRDRNNRFGSLPLRLDADREPGPDASQRYPRNRAEREYDIDYPCTLDTPQTGVVDQANTCGTEFDRRYNPSDSLNVRGNSRFTLAQGLVLTVDPSFQSTRANGGGTITGREGFRRIGGVDYTGYIGGQYYFGRDLNGDGDTLDTCSTTGGSCASTNRLGVTLRTPSHTRTIRTAVITGIRWDLSEDQSLRFTYTYDRSNHRQTAPSGYLKSNGEPVEMFPADAPIEDANGNVLQGRDRQSYAILNQVAGEYRGEFGPLTVNAGVRLPYFKRDLESYCFTTSASGFVDCFAGDEELEADYAAEFPTRQGPQRRVLKYNKLLPNLGAVYDFAPSTSAFVSYAKGLSVPSTDSLYDAFFFPVTEDRARPNPETTDTFEGGLRYRNSKIQAQASVWRTKFNNRLASAYDPDLDETVFRNLGRVNKWGIDGSVAWEPVRAATLYAFGSWNRSKIRDNLQINDNFNAGVDCDSVDPTTVLGLRNCAFTAGKRESGSPSYMYGGSGVLRFGNVELGATAKRTGPRFIYDTNQPVFTGDVDRIGTTHADAPRVIYGAKAPAYWLVHLDARYKLSMLKGLENSYFQLNVYNLFDKFYVGGFGGGLNQSVNSGGFYGNPSFVQIGAPRTISGTLNLAF